ncbi:hypothetical protein [Streptomyces sp. NBC_00572]|uniref:hypothetical protein n=1 Tax=Streptomyces sp. NBC_00572 TaxID=2903664 RepID=UPI00224C9071|nr:hypothetical protein [Streptomyces sp. NBC_00572]MCX4983921.1 hypothetical protein [Streptomyces sp. NBC_00572]
MPKGDGTGSLQQVRQVLVTVLNVSYKDWQQRLASAGAVGHPPVDLATPLAEPLEISRQDRAGSHPSSPPLRFGDGPTVKVDVEAADGQQHRGSVFSQPGPVGLAVLPPVLDLGPPLVVELLAEVQVLLIGVEFLDDGPEQAGQLTGETFEGDVVGVGLAPGEVVDQELPDCGVLDVVAVDEFLDASLTVIDERPQGRGRSRREVPHPVQDLPGAQGRETRGSLGCAGRQPQTFVLQRVVQQGRRGQI